MTEVDAGWRDRATPMGTYGVGGDLSDTQIHRSTVSNTEGEPCVSP